MAFHFAEDERQRFFHELWSHWQRGVHLFRRPFSSPLATQDDFWEVIKNWSRDVRAGKRFVPPRWIDEDLLPNHADPELMSFCRRIEGQDRQDWYLYQGDGVQQWNPLLWHRAVELVRPILDRVGGLPPGGIRFECFLGRYSRTVTGIHRDEADGLAFVTLGPKRLYFWPRETFEDRWASPDGTHFQTGTWNYEKYLASAIAIEADAGDVIYWPRGYYHIGASPDHWSGMVTLSLWWQASAQRAIRIIVDSILSGDGVPVTYPLKLDFIAAGAQSVPAVLVHASEDAQAALNSRWNETLAEAWARVVTGYGFLTAPALQKTTEIRATRYFVRHPIAVVEIAGRRQVFACGHKLPAPADAALALAEGLQKLSIGETLQLPAECAGTTSASAERGRLLGALLAVGAIVPA